MDRNATAIWHGGIKDGKGTLTTQSGVLHDQQYSFASRFESGTGTNPEELIAAAHAGCYAMALSNLMTGEKITPESIETKAVVTLEVLAEGPSVTKIHLTVKAKVPGVDQAKFDELTKTAKENCPISKLLKAATITMDASLL